MARAVLTDGGFAVVGEAIDAQSALSAARQVKPDCVLLDVQLGEVDGFTVAETLAEQDHRPAVVLTSGRDPGEMLPLIEASPARGFIAKERLSPSALEELLR